ncbi:hypothetical protein AA103587_2361 [Gluconobacter kanchanaburiensis NBRC 103587]|nr:hypothetical protein AA103587_2361 [Gluconobacter kanchanaburiensis NBRC 103587]
MAIIIVAVSSAGVAPLRKATTRTGVVTVKVGVANDGAVVTGAWAAAKAASESGMVSVVAGWAADALAGASAEALVATSEAKGSRVVAN